MATTLLFFAIVAVFVEVLAYFLVPRIFVALALLPVGLKRRVELPVPTLERLTAHLATDEKGRVRRELDLARVAWPTSIQTDTVIGKGAGAGVWVRVQQAGWLPQGWGVARIGTRQKKDDLVLRARFVPVPFLSPLLLLASLGLAVATEPAAVGAAFTAGLVLGVWGAIALAVRAQLHTALVPVLATLETTLTSGAGKAELGPKQR